MRWINKELKNVDGFYDSYDDDSMYDKYEIFRDNQLDDDIDFNLGEIERRLTEKEMYTIMDDLNLSRSDIEMGYGSELLSHMVNSNEIEKLTYESDILWDKNFKGVEKILQNGFKIMYNFDSKSRVYVCPICNDIKYFNGVYECNECGFNGINRPLKESNGEKFIDKSLKELNLDFKREVVEIKNYRFDFVVKYNDVKYYIEVNGLQHYQPIEYFGGIDCFNKTKIRDAIKRKYANESGIYIELDYREHDLVLLNERFEKEFINKYIKGTM